MIKLKSFHLMLKQGIKGVFKFKIQFIIIVLLSFVATFILSISLSTESRLRDSYNKIVKPVDRFAYSGTVRINNTVSDTSDYLFMPNLVNNTGTSVINIAANGESDASKTASYNWVLENKQFENKDKAQDWMYKDESGAPYISFLTKGTDEFINAINSGTNVIGANGFHTITPESNWFYDNTNNWGAFALYDVYLKNFWWEINQISMLSKEGNKPEEIKNAMAGSQTIYSPAGMYTYKNPNWFSNVVTISNFKVNDDGIATKGDIAIKDLNGDNENEYDIFVTINYGVAQIVSQLSQTINLLNTNVPDEYSTGISCDPWSIKNVGQATEFLFGNRLNGYDETNSPLKPGIPDKNDWLLKDDFSNAYTINPNLDKASINEDYVFATPFGGKENDLNMNSIWHSGLRGIINPIINPDSTIKNASENNFANVSNFNYLKMIDFNHNPENRNRSLLYDLGIDDTYYGTQTWSSALSTMETAINGANSNSWIFNANGGSQWTAYNRIVSGAAGFKYGIRLEETNYDTISATTFRTIVIDPHMDYNLVYLEGHAPSINGGVAINEQYAKKNHIKVGSQIKIINRVETVSGIVSDAFSYIPGQDLNVPIPNSKVSAFVYANIKTVLDINDANADSDSTNESQLFDTLSYFLWDKENNKNTVAQRKLYWDALHLDKDKGLGNNYSAIKTYIDKGTIDNTSSNMSLTSFDKSPFKYSWSVLPMVLKIYDSIVYTASAVIALVAISALVVSVKKTIDFNSKQIGILKALGETPTTISMSYISYSILIGFIVVPIAWIIGIVGQIGFAGLFSNYFSIIPNALSFEWMSLVIAFSVLGLLSGLVAFFSAYILNRRPIITILYSSVKWGKLHLLDWIKSKLPKRSPFNVRLSIQLTSSGSRQIILMTIVMFIASFLMSASIALPAIVAKVNGAYYKAIKYSNKFDDIPLISNAPLSKASVSYWDGQDFADSQYAADNEILPTGYYKDMSTYYDTLNNANIFSQYVYDKASDKAVDSYTYMLNNFSKFIPNLMAIVGNKMSNGVGDGVSVGSIDALYGALVHNVDASLGQSEKKNFEFNKNSNSAFTDNDRIAGVNQINGSLADNIPAVMNIIVNGQGKGSDAGITGATWKEKVLSAIYSALPSFIKSYVQKSPSRQDQYAISWQNEIYIPTQETLATTITDKNQIINSKSQDVSATGLDKNQNSIIISDANKDKIYLPYEIKQQIYDVVKPAVNSSISNDIWYNNIKIYDHISHTLTIPAVVNMQGQSAYNLKPGNELKNWTNSLGIIQFNSDGVWKNLPADAWVYDDTEYANYAGNDSKLKGVAYAEKSSEYDSQQPNKYWIWTQKNNHYYIDPAKIDSGKLTFNQQFDDEGKLKDQATMFKEFKYGEKGIPNGTFLRPEYDYKNFKIMLPLDWFGGKKNEDSLLWSDGTGHTVTGKEKTKGWYDDSLKGSDIPDSVKDAYLRLARNSNGVLSENALSDTSDWLAINPYDRAYYDGNHYQTSPIDYIVTKTAFWYRYMRSGNSLFRVQTNEDLNDYLNSVGAPSDLKVNIKSVGDIDSYNNKLIVIDSDLANMLKGYANTRAYQYNYQLFDTSHTLKANHLLSENDPDYDYWKGNKSAMSKSKFDRWKLVDTSADSFIDHDWASDSKDGVQRVIDDKDLWRPKYYKLADNDSILNYAPHSYFDTKFSNLDEPLDISGSISFSTQMRLGQFSIGQTGTVSDGGMTLMFQSQELLSTVRALTNEIAALAIYIGMMLVIAIIITAALLTMLTGDIYISQYKRFMVLLRAIGYSNLSIAAYSFGTVSVLAFAAWILGVVLAWLAIFAGVQVLWAHGLAIPVGLTWWPILLSFAILTISYIGALYVSSIKARRTNPSEVLTATAE